MLANIYVRTHIKIAALLFLLSQLPVIFRMRTFRDLFRSGLIICVTIINWGNTCGCANTRKKVSLTFIVLLIGGTRTGFFPHRFRKSQLLGHAISVHQRTILFGSVVTGIEREYTHFVHKRSLDICASI